MQVTSKTTLIRGYIGVRLESLGAFADSPLTESLLMRDGMYCGHRFQRDRFQAVWFVEEDQIKFFDADGALVEKVRASEVEHFAPQRQAA